MITHDILPHNLKLTYSVVRSGKEPEYYSYDVLYHEWDEAKRESLYSSWYPLYQSKTIRLNCMCNPNKKIDMVLFQNKTSGKVFLRTKSDMKQLHLPGCNFEGQSLGTYHQNWIQEKDGSITIRFEDSYSVKNRETGAVTPSSTTQSKSRHTFNQITMFAFFYRLLIDAWNINIRSHKKGNQKIYPTLNRVYSTASSLLAPKMKFGGSYTINDVLFDGKELLGKAANTLANTKQLKLLVLLELDEETREAGSDKYKLIGKHIGTGKSFSIMCDSQMWESAKASIRNTQGTRLVGGWIIKQPNQIAEFSSVTIIPISSCGVPIESSYERTFYDKCHAENRLIVRPFDLSFYPSWEGMLPDGLFIDTEVDTIVEIFGMTESDEQYHERKRHKVRHFSTLKDYPNKPFHLWCWDAYKGDKLPELPPTKENKS